MGYLSIKKQITTFEYRIHRYINIRKKGYIFYEKLKSKNQWYNVTHA